MIEISDVKYSYIKGKPVLDGLSFSFDKELVVIYGGVGFGKSTLCKIIAREIKKFDGEIKINGVDIKRKRAKELNVSYITDDFMLNKNQTVRQNAAKSLVIKKIPKNEIPLMTERALIATGMEKLGDMKVKDLSDCDKFLTALSRSVAKRPDLIMLDDVFFGFDEKTRLSYYKKVEPIIKSLEFPVLFLTSDDFVAYSYDARTIVISYGKQKYDGLFSRSIYVNELNKSLISDK